MNRFTLALALQTAVATQQPASPPSAPIWEMNWGDQFCTLVRRPEPGNQLILGFRLLPGVDSPAIVLMTQGSSSLPAGVDKVVLAPSGRSFDVTGRDEDRRNGGHALLLFGLSSEFLDALAASNEIRLVHGDQVRAHVGLPDTRGAVGAIRACKSDALREWGVDEAAMNALQRQPRSTNDMGIDYSDYPTQALRENRQGRVVVRVTISAEGRPTECVPVATSHFAAFDSATCDAIMRRGRFEPALDANGRPIAAQMIRVTSYLIAE